MKSINLSWNKIKGKGGISIAEAIRDNPRVQFFDGSFNMFGIKRDGVFGAKIGEACCNGGLRHLDISYNSMDLNECTVFG
jgi:hypothetical protein